MRPIPTPTLHQSAPHPCPSPLEGEGIKERGLYHPEGEIIILPLQGGNGEGDGGLLRS